MNFINEQDLKNLIGCTRLDKMELQDGRIIEVKNMEELIDRCIVINNTTPNSYLTIKGQQFSSLHIKNDGAIHKLRAGWSGYGREYVTLSTGVHDSKYHNLIGYTVEDYQRQIESIEKRLENEYGIIASFKDANIKYLEINRTFKIDHPFNEYRRILNLIISEMPRMNIVSMFGKSEVMDVDTSEKVNNITTFTAWNRRNGHGRARSYKAISIYDKKNQIKATIYLEDDYIRFEIKLVGMSNIKKALGTTKLYELSDLIINEYFLKQIEELIIKPLDRWRTKRDRYILCLMKSEREKDIHNWQVNVLRALNTKENQQNGKPCLLDVAELVELVDQLKDIKRKQRVKNTFIRQAHKYEKIFCNRDDNKLVEIIANLTKKTSERDRIVAHQKVA